MLVLYFDNNLSHFDTISLCDGQTDGRTERHISTAEHRAGKNQSTQFFTSDALKHSQ